MDWTVIYGKHCFFWGWTGQTLECSLAKPQANSHKPAVLPAYPPHLGYGGMIGSAIGAGFGTAGFAQVALRLVEFNLLVLQYSK